MKPPWAILVIPLLLLAGPVSGAGIILKSVDIGSPEYRIGEEVLLTFTVDAASPVNRVDLALEGPLGMVFRDQSPVEFTLVSEHMYRGYYQYLLTADLQPGTYCWSRIRVARTGQENSALGDPTTGPLIQLSKTNNEYSAYYQPVEFSVLAGDEPFPAVIETPEDTVTSGLQPVVTAPAPTTAPVPTPPLIPPPEIVRDIYGKPDSIPDISFPGTPGLLPGDNGTGNPALNPTTPVPAGSSELPPVAGNITTDIPGTGAGPANAFPQNITEEPGAVPLIPGNNGTAPQTGPVVHIISGNSSSGAPVTRLETPETLPDDLIPGTAPYPSPDSDPVPAVNLNESPGIVPNSSVSQLYVNLTTDRNLTLPWDAVNVSELRNRQLGNTTGLAALRDRMMNSFGGLSDSASGDEQSIWSNRSYPLSLHR